jgi:ribosomal protein S18 acetylase RimI-like enzyme
MKIRIFEDGDLAATIQLWRDCELLINPLNDPAKDIAFCRDSGHGEILLGIDDGGELVASVMVGHDGHRGWIYYLATHPNQQGNGRGRKMTAAAEAWLQKRNVPKVELLVRDTNTRVIGFYQRCGYNVEPREIMSRRLDGVALPLAQQDDDAPVVITYLAMDERPSLPQIEPKYKHYALLRANQPTVSFYRYLYDAVGREWFWTDRKRYTDAELKEILEHPANDLFVVYVEGSPAGFFELNRREMPTIDLAYFGILPDFIGGRLGPWLLGQALDEIWRHDPERATVNTCTLDHPSALPMYQRYGFQAYGREDVPAPWHRQVPAMDDF